MKDVAEYFESKKFSVTELCEGRIASRCGAAYMVWTVKRTGSGTMVKKTHKERDMLAGMLVLGMDRTSLSQDVKYTLRKIKEEQEYSVLAFSCP